MARGGYRAGAGRKTKTDEDRARKLCVAAIEKKYGSVEQGLIALLESDEPSLKRFVFEHALGKPTEKVDMTSDGEAISNVYKFEIPKNGREYIEKAMIPTNGNGSHH